MSKINQAQIQATNDSHDNHPFYLKNKVVLASSKFGSHSLRATVPEGIVAFLDLKAGDQLEWRMDIQNDKRVVVARKVASLTNEESK